MRAAHLAQHLLPLVARRLLSALVVVWFVVTVVFVLVHTAPGDPIATSLSDPRVSESVRAHWRHAYGLDQPLPVQYGKYLWQLAHGNLGYSTSRAEPVAHVVARALRATITLAGTALILSFALGIALGVWQATRPNTATDRTLTTTLLALYSMPDFWLAQLAMLLFAYWIPILPAGGAVDPVLHPYMGWAAATADRIRHLILPVWVLTALSCAAVARYQRAQLLTVTAEDYVRTARAKGLSERAVILHHALRNALLPTISLFGLSLPAFLGGQVLIEKVFSWPGLGALAIDAVGARDYAVVIACAIVTSVLVVLGSMVADVLYAIADPRVRRQTQPA